MRNEAKGYRDDKENALSHVPAIYMHRGQEKSHLQKNGVAILQREVPLSQLAQQNQLMQQEQAIYGYIKTKHARHNSGGVVRVHGERYNVLNQPEPLYDHKQHYRY